MTAGCIELPALCVHHSGADPVYRSAALDRVVPIIQSLTRVDESGRRYWRPSFHEGWRRLRTSQDFAALNAAIDHKRGMST